MNLLGQVIIGIIMIVVGILLLKNNYQVANNLRISFAEQHMGSGGSYTLWKILAVLVIIGGFIVMFGLGDNLLAWILSPLTNSVNQG